ncbi:MAG: SulP family inorganic anion transporter [Trichloromonas sp.]|jgi:SulP family sulfate permease|nr:SulP family inorganic anion transporter [Trichloromonas sp.]
MPFRPSSYRPEWLRTCRRVDLSRGLAAGAEVAVVLAPQAMAYALLAGLPPIVGLYAATVPLLAYALPGSSRQLAAGPVAIVSLLVHVACAKLAAPAPPEYFAVALQLALLTGLLQLALEQLAGLLPAALTIALIGDLESYAIARIIGDQDRYRIRPNRELLGLGAANLAAPCFSGYPVTGGFSRTAVNHQAGARTHLSGVVTALLIGIILFRFTHLFHDLPKTILAAIVMVAVAGLVEIAEARYLFRVKKSGGYTFLLTFLVTLTFGVEIGIIRGVVFSLLVFIWRSAHPHIAELGWLAEEGVYRNVRRDPRVRVDPELFIVRIDASLYFANMAFIEDWLRAALAQRPRVIQILFDLSGVNDMDAVALAKLEELCENFENQGIGFACAGMKGPLRDLTGRAGWPAKYGQRISFPTLQQAVGELTD